MCFAKDFYPSYEAAENAAARVAISRGIPTRVYQCPICIGYHLTKSISDPGEALERLISIARRRGISSKPWRRTRRGRRRP